MKLLLVETFRPQKCTPKKLIGLLKFKLFLAIFRIIVRKNIRAYAIIFAHAEVKFLAYFYLRFVELEKWKINL